MNENKSNLPNPQVTERQRAIIEAGNLIDALADECPNVERIQATWRQTFLRVRGAIQELRTLAPQDSKEEVN